MSPDLLLDAHAILGEGPFWHPRHHRLFWVDIEGHAVHDTNTPTGADTVIPVAEQVGCIAPAGDRLLVMGLRSGFAALDLDTRRRVHIEDPEHHLPENRFNDGKCDPAGRFWAGTMAISEAEDQGSLYCLGTTLKVSCKVPGVSVSNGLAWSLDAKTMYYVDSPDRRVVAYDYDRATGAIDRARTVYDVPDGWGFPRRHDDRRRRLPLGRALGRRSRAPPRPLQRTPPRPDRDAGVSTDVVRLRRRVARRALRHEREHQPHPRAARRPAPRRRRVRLPPGVTGLPVVEFGGTPSLERLFS